MYISNWYIGFWKITANISVSCLDDERFYCIDISFKCMEMNLIFMDQWKLRNEFCYPRIFRIPFSSFLFTLTHLEHSKLMHLYYLQQFFSITGVNSKALTPVLLYLFLREETPSSSWQGNMGALALYDIFSLSLPD